MQVMCAYYLKFVKKKDTTKWYEEEQNVKAMMG